MATTVRPGQAEPSSRRSTRFDLPLDLLRIPKSGAAYDLSSGWWPGMPLAEGHPPFHVMTYRSPAGERNQKDMRFLDDNPLNYGFISELMMCTTHTGTHIDALAHITCGPKSTWHGGFSADEFLGDFGPMRNDASQLPPLFRRGVLLDIPKTLGVDHLAPHQSVGTRELEAACSRKGVALEAGDLVLIRTGAMLQWPEAGALAACEGSGLSIEGAQWLVAKGVSAFAGDNAVLEVAPSGIKGDPQPVHRFLIQEKGLLILEWVYPEELSRDDVSEFLFVCLPLTVSAPPVQWCGPSRSCERSDNIAVLPRAMQLRQEEETVNNRSIGILAGALLAASQMTAGGVAHADQFPAQYSGPTEPAKAPEKLKVTAITCLSILHGCVSPAEGLQHAGKALGWDVTIVDGGGNPSKQNSAMLDAVSSGSKVIALVAVDPSAVQLGLKAAKDAGVLVVSGSNGIDTPNPVVKPAANGLWVAFDIGPNYAALGNAAADWIIKDSGGKANIGVFSDKEFPSVLAFEAGLLEGLKKCTSCVVSPQQYFTGNQVGATLAQMTVGYLRSHPETTYLFSPFDPAAGAQVPAIVQAGMRDKVKLVGVLGDQQNLDFIRKGTVQVADAAYENEYMGWAMADQIIRSLNKQPLFDPHGENLPFTVLDKTNLPPPGSDWVANFDYKSKFLSLWKGK